MEIKFGTDGWRGIIDQDFTEDNVTLAVKAIAKYLEDHGKSSLVVGYDVRRKASDFANLAADVLASRKIKVYLVDKPCPTPVTGWSIIDKKTDGAIMLTASHNPAEFLGLKFMTNEAMVAPSDVTDEFTKNAEEIENNNISETGEVKKDLIEIFDPKPAYLARIKELVNVEKIKDSNLSILVNPMHAAGIGYLSEILNGGAIKVEEMNNVADHTFGGLSPEPIVEENVHDAIEKMKTGQFNVCLSSDGDADRIGLIDENGRMLTSLQAFLLLVYYFIVIKGQRGPIVRTLSNTIMADHLAKKYNLEVIETKVGFKYVGEAMKESGAIFGGEESGGSAVDNFMLVRDAQIMNLFILDLMAETKKPLSEILTLAEEEAGGAYEFRRQDVHFEYDEYDKIKENATEQLLKNTPQEVLGKSVKKTRTDDGIKIIFDDDSWLLIRFSGTEPSLRLYAEAKTKEEVDSLLQFAENYIKKLA